MRAVTVNLNVEFHSKDILISLIRWLEFKYVPSIQPQCIDATSSESIIRVSDSESVSHVIFIIRPSEWIPNES